MQIYCSLFFQFIDDGPFNIESFFQFIDDGPFKIESFMAS